MNLVSRFLRKYITKENDSEFVIIPIGRNETCFCNSGLKFKKCHSPKLEKENKIAIRIIDRKTKEEKIEIIKKENFKTSSNLRWVDIGVGDTGKIE